jgi:cell volume regulation protein A
VVSWLGLRGAVPIVLATFAFTAGIANASTVFSVVFFIVLTSALVQGTTAIPLIRRLGLATAQAPVEVITEALPIEGTGIDMVEVTVPDDSALVGQLLRSVPAPESALVTAVARGEEVLLPRGDTRICPGDLLVVTTTDREHGIEHIEQWVCRGRDHGRPVPAGEVTEVTDPQG